MKRLCSYLALLLIATPRVPSQTITNPTPREHFASAVTLYDWASDSAGHKLRMLVTRPKDTSRKVPAIFFVGWLSCDSVEYPQGGTDGFGAIFWRLIDQSGYATVRLDKAGVGESEGDCSKLDFNTELTGYQSAFDKMLKYDFIDSGKIIVAGLSNGGGTSALIPRDHAVRGYIAASSWGRTWYEHMLELERGRLARAAKSPSEVNVGVKVFTEFYHLYLIQHLTPGQVLAQRPEWKSWWYDQPDGQYGRPAAFYQQLQALNLGDAWAAVAAPVLVFHGSADTIMSDADSRAIADTVNQAHPEMARYAVVPGGDHLLSVNGKLEESVVPTMLQWMTEQLKN
ncbi:MAG TPA: alpha/beta hydrolase [Terriglobales bacterium]|nr:alpha/beta hydrolase [Terriglobales bacterium]